MSNFITDWRKVQDYMKNVLRYNGEFVFNTVDNYVNLKNHLLVTRLQSSLGNSPALGIKLQTCLNVSFSELHFTSLDNFPKICKNLVLCHMNDLQKDLEINTITSGELSIVDCIQIQSLKTINSRLDIRNTMRQRTDEYISTIALTDIEFSNKIQHIDLAISGAPLIKSFDQIKSNTNNFLNLSLYECGITSLPNKEYNIIHACNLSLPLNSFVGIDKFTAGTLCIDIINSCDNIIHLLNNKSVIIKLKAFNTAANIPPNSGYNRNNAVICSILRRYLDVDKRSDYIMDCAVDLIDAHYNAAAEL